MEINGPSRISGAESIRNLQSTQSIQPQQATEGLQPMDQIDISPEAEFVSRVGDLPEIRADRVSEIRAEIDAGTYETDEKLDLAVGRLLDEIG